MKEPAIGDDGRHIYDEKTCEVLTIGDVLARRIGDKVTIVPVNTLSDVSDLGAPNTRIFALGHGGQDTIKLGREEAFWDSETKNLGGSSYIPDDQFNDPNENACATRLLMEKAYDNCQVRFLHCLGGDRLLSLEDAIEKIGGN